MEDRQVLRGSWGWGPVGRYLLGPFGEPMLLNYGQKTAKMVSVHKRKKSWLTDELKPFTAFRAIHGTFNQKFDFNLRRDHQK